MPLRRTRIHACCTKTVIHMHLIRTHRVDTPSSLHSCVLEVRRCFKCSPLTFCVRVLTIGRLAVQATCTARFCHRCGAPERGVGVSVLQPGTSGDASLSSPLVLCAPIVPAQGNRMCAHTACAGETLDACSPSMVFLMDAHAPGGSNT